jgi:hypothetical protein
MYAMVTSASPSRKGKSYLGNLELNRKKAGNEKANWETSCHISRVCSSWIVRALFSNKWQLLAKSIRGFTNTYTYAPAEPVTSGQSLVDTDTCAGTRACTEHDSNSGTVGNLLTLKS